MKKKMEMKVEMRMISIIDLITELISECVNLYTKYNDNNIMNKQTVKVHTNGEFVFLIIRSTYLVF